MQEHNLISQECERLREENMRLLYHSKSTINLKEHEEQIRNLSNNNKQLSGKYKIQHVLLSSHAYFCYASSIYRVHFLKSHI